MTLLRADEPVPIVSADMFKIKEDNSVEQALARSFSFSE